MKGKIVEKIVPLVQYEVTIEVAQFSRKFKRSVHGNFVCDPERLNQGELAHPKN